MKTRDSAVSTPAVKKTVDRRGAAGRRADQQRAATTTVTRTTTGTRAAAHRAEKDSAQPVYSEDKNTPVVVAGQYNTLSSWAKHNLKPNIENGKMTKKQAATALLAQTVQVGKDPRDLSDINTQSVLAQVANDLGIVKEMNALGLYYIHAKPSASSLSTGVVSTNPNEAAPVTTARRGDNWTVSTGDTPSYKTAVSNSSAKLSEGEDLRSVRITPENYQAYLLRDESGKSSTVLAATAKERFDQGRNSDGTDRGLMEWEEPAMRDWTMRFPAAAERVENPMYAIEGSLQILNSLRYADDPEALEKANARLRKRMAAYTMPEMRPPETTGELAADFLGSGYGSALLSKLFGHMLSGGTDLAARVGDEVLFRTGNWRAAQKVQRMMENVIIGAPESVMRGLATEGDTGDKLSAIYKNLANDAKSGAAMDAVGEALAFLRRWIGAGSKTGSTGLTVPGDTGSQLADDAYFARIRQYLDTPTSDADRFYAYYQRVMAQMKNPGKGANGRQALDGGSVTQTRPTLSEADEFTTVVSDTAAERTPRRFTKDDLPIDSEPRKVYNISDKWQSETAKSRPYDVRAEVAIPATGQHSHDRYHSNKEFYLRMKNDPEFKQEMDDFFGYDVMAYMKSGKRGYKNPSPDWEWHHPTFKNGEVDLSRYTMELVPKWQHHDKRYSAYMLDEQGGGSYRIKSIKKGQEEIRP